MIKKSKTSQAKIEPRKSLSKIKQAKEDYSDSEEEYV